MFFKKLLTQEQVGFAVGYTAAFIVDNFVKVSAVKCSYRTVSWVAGKTKIVRPSAQVLFERIVDGVWQAY